MLNNSLTLDYPIIVHCHLHWVGVWLRPQQFLSRLSKRNRRLIVDGPNLRDTSEAPTARLIAVQAYPNVTVMQTFFSVSRFPEGRWVDAERCRLLAEALEGPLVGQFDRPVQWFYDPMAAPAHVGKFN